MKMQIKAQAENVSRAITRESFSVAQKIALLRDILTTESSFKFSQLFTPETGRNEYITTFLAILELLKLQIINVKQADLFEDFTITKREGSDEIEAVVEDEYESFE